MRVSEIAAPPPDQSCRIVRCRFCRHVLPELALKCTKCSSWQHGWRAAIPLTDASLSMLLALISVLTVVVPLVMRTLSHESSTRVAVVAADTSGNLQVTFSNVGGRPSVLRSYRIDFLGEGSILPSSELTLRTPKAALLEKQTDATVDLFGAEPIPLETSRQAELDRWINSGVVRLTVCVKESSSGVAKANALARAGTCESLGLVTRTDSIAAIHLSDWIRKGLVRWNEEKSASR